MSLSGDRFRGAVLFFRQLSVFSVVGVLATLNHTLVASLVIYVFSTGATVANTLGYCFSVPISYYGHTRYSFNSHFSMSGFFRFFFVNSWLFGIALIISLLIDYFSVNPYMGVFVTVIVIPVSSFLVHKFYTFKPQH